MSDAPSPAMHRRLVEALYLDTMVLADEARDYGEHQARDDALAVEAAGGSGAAGVVFSCEALRLTTRLMHLLAWLLGQRAIAAGEMDADAPSARLTQVAETAPLVLARLPERAAVLIATSEALYRRAAALDTGPLATRARISPARALQQRLAIGLRG